MHRFDNSYFSEFGIWASRIGPAMLPTCTDFGGRQQTFVDIAEVTYMLQGPAAATEGSRQAAPRLRLRIRIGRSPGQK